MGKEKGSPRRKHPKENWKKLHWTRTMNPQIPQKNKKFKKTQSESAKLLHQSTSSREESKDSVVDPHTSRKDILSKAVKSGRFISYCAWLYYFVLFLKVNGVNVLHLLAKTPYLFGLQLLDMLFTRAELSSSLLFKSTKSERGVLDPTKVSRIIDIMNKRYNQTEWNMATFVSKANQNTQGPSYELFIHIGLLRLKSRKFWGHPKTWPPNFPALPKYTLRREIYESLEPQKERAAKRQRYWQSPEHAHFSEKLRPLKVPDKYLP
ncbi:hypothetical protein EMCRGX_G009564 [Ephydatia muelleri]